MVCGRPQCEATIPGKYPYGITTLNCTLIAGHEGDHHADWATIPWFDEDTP